MTAPLFAPASESYSSSSVESLFNYRSAYHSSDSKAPRLAARRSPSSIAGRNGSSFGSSATSEPGNLGAIWSSLLELLPQGVLIVSRNLTLIYWNAKARELCQQQMGIDLSANRLPDAISEACHRLLRDSDPSSTSLLIKDERPGQDSLRISARWVAPVTGSSCPSPVNPNSLIQQAYLQGGRADTPACIAIFLENCDEVLEQEMRIQQKKYDLTDREAEICKLLRKEYTYQEIAKLLQISLNTVKTHVKNIYAKRRSYQGEEKILIL